MTRRLLYVEDDPANVTLMRAVIRRIPDCELQVASTVRQGIDVALAGHFSLYLVDIHLPDGSGLEVMARLASTPTTASVPLVVITADTTAATLHAARAYTRFVFTKPFTVVDLLETLTRLLGPSASPH